ncbi:hypothetical protein NY605_22090 [Enterobacter hormaechei]|uniref:hypothetical protein n=1 Tax=Enterobacter hormaechei TaxID=158836 RepID=UPI0022F0A0AC|nr:hypothetical protein [Enterobacter hormaechei]MDA4741994.1 hypothetical protein [Enterobacter hormaechei]
MQVKQQLISHRGKLIPLPLLNVGLHVSPEFTGRVVVHIKEGRQICDYPLREAEHINTLSGFLALARQAGWMVIPPEEIAEGGASGTDSNTNS